MTYHSGPAALSDTESDPYEEDMRDTMPPPARGGDHPTQPLTAHEGSELQWAGAQLRRLDASVRAAKESTGLQGAEALWALVERL